MNGKGTHYIETTQEVPNRYNGSGRLVSSPFLSFVFFFIKNNISRKGKFFFYVHECVSSKWMDLKLNKLIVTNKVIIVPEGKLFVMIE